MKIKQILPIIVVILLFTSCYDNKRGANDVSERTERTEYALGTIISARVYNLDSMDDMDDKTTALALDEAFERLYEIEAIASAKKPDSELSYVNQNAFEQDIRVSDELFFLLKTGLYYSRLTDGAFDIALGALIDLWGESVVPDANDIERAVLNSGYENITLNEEAQTVRFLRPELKIDLGAIAKGYAADEMKRVLIQNGVTEAVLDLGGDVIVIGDNENLGLPPASGRIVGLTDPLSPNRICAKLKVFDQAIVTSGDYERYFIYEGRKYHHILDRETGCPADSKIISATIIADSAMTADALSTAFFVMGFEKSKSSRLAESFSNNADKVEYVLIDKDMNFYCSEGLEIEIID